MTAFLPTVLTHDAEAFRARLDHIKPLFSDDAVPMASVDVIDGAFVHAPRTYVTPEVVSATDDMPPFEVDLMTIAPEEDFAPWIAAGAQRIFFHPEAVDDLRMAVKTARVASKVAGPAQIGLSLNPETPLNVVDPVIGDIDVVQLMGVHPGKNGAPFLPETVDRVRSLKQRHPGILIHVDGGVRPGTAGDLSAAGADVLAVGSAFSAEDPIAVLEELKRDAEDHA